jgi:hypothetical protein
MSSLSSWVKSGWTRAYSSSKTVVASSKVTECFRRFDAALRGSQVKCMPCQQLVRPATARIHVDGVDGVGTRATWVRLSGNSLERTCALGSVHGATSSAAPVEPRHDAETKEPAAPLLVDAQVERAFGERKRRAGESRRQDRFSLFQDALKGAAARATTATGPRVLPGGSARWVLGTGGQRPGLRPNPRPLLARIVIDADIP